MAALVGLPGCATWGPAPSAAMVALRQVAAPSAEVWEASLQALAPAALRRQDAARGLLETDWIEGDSSRTQGVLLGGGAYKRRVRYRLTLSEDGSGTQVRVLAWLEERPPGGPRSLRWERVRPTAEQFRWLFDAIQARLSVEAGAPDA